MHKYLFKALTLIVGFTFLPVLAQTTNCFESRKTAGRVQMRVGEDGRKNVTCSEQTSAALWWQDPFADTITMPGIGSEDNSAIIKPRTKTLTLYAVCGVACHNGNYPAPPDNNNPRRLMMHNDVVPNASKLQHGNGSLWCLNCHHKANYKSFIDNFGNEIPMDAVPLLCGKCHGEAFATWRDGIHGKLMGEWRSDGKKRWFTCTECHNPHDVDNRGFKAVEPEPPPPFPESMRSWYVSEKLSE